MVPILILISLILRLISLWSVLDTGKNQQFTEQVGQKVKMLEVIFLQPIIAVYLLKQDEFPDILTKARAAGRILSSVR